MTLNPVKATREDYQTWRESDRQLLDLLRGIVEIPLGFGTLFRFLAHIAVYLMLLDIREETHDLSDDVVHQQLSTGVTIDRDLAFGDELAMRVGAALFGIILYRCGVYGMPENALFVFYTANCAVMVCDPLLGAIDRAG
jgi:hypothetical protein